MIVFNVFSKDESAFLNDKLEKPIEGAVHIVLNSHTSYEIAKLIRNHSTDERLHALRYALGEYYRGE
jgi:hypothetical protein